MKEWELCKCFHVINTVHGKLLPGDCPPPTLTLTLTQEGICWGAKQGYNGFLQINIPFSFSRINHRLLVIMDGCSKYCEINSALDI